MISDKRLRAVASKLAKEALSFPKQDGKVYVRWDNRKAVAILRDLLIEKERQMAKRVYPPFLLDGSKKP